MENIDIQTNRRSLASLTSCLPCVFQGTFLIISTICSIRKEKKNHYISEILCGPSFQVTLLHFIYLSGGFVSHSLKTVI